MYMLMVPSFLPYLFTLSPDLTHPISLAVLIASGTTREEDREIDIDRHKRIAADTGLASELSGDLPSSTVAP